MGNLSVNENATQINNSGLVSKNINFDNIIKNRLDPLQKASNAFKLKVDIEQKKLAALQELKNLTDGLKNSSKKITDNSINGAFSQKSSSLSTTDNGSADGYLKVFTDSTARVGSIDLKVNQVATRASYTLKSFTKGDGNTQEFDNTNPQLNANQITITISGIANNIALAGTDTIFDVANKINSDMILNAEVDARIITSPQDNRSYLQIITKNTGQNTITAAFNFNNANSINNADYANTAGVDAQITTNDGVQLNSDSNKIQLTTGVTIELLKANIGGMQTISIDNDVDAAKTGIEDFFVAWNEYALFSAKQKENIDGKLADTAVLAYTQELREADNLITQLYTSINGSIKNIFDLGIERQTVPASKDSPSFNGFTINQEKLKNVLSREFMDVKALFVGEKYIEAVGFDNTGSILNFSSTSNFLSNSVNGKIFYLKIDISNAGTVNTVEYSFADKPLVSYYGTYTPKTPNTGTISFDGTSLEGLVFDYNINGANNNDENFTFMLANGINEKFNSKLGIINNNNLDVSGNKIGLVNKSIDQLTASIKNDEVQLANLQKSLDERKAELEKQKQTIYTIDLELSRIERLFDALTGE